MKTSRFKTNAKCSGCVDKIAAALDSVVKRNQWNLDLSTPEKILEITSDMSDADIIKIIENAGFKAEIIN